MEYTLLLMEKVYLEIVIKAGDEDYDFSLNQQQQLSDWHLGWNHCLFAVNLEQVFHLVLMSSSLNFNMLFRDVRSSSPEVFCKKGVLKNFEKNHWKTPVPQPATSLKKRLWTGVFLWILQNFYEQLFYRTPPSDYFWIDKKYFLVQMQFNFIKSIQIS